MVRWFTPPAEDVSALRAFAGDFDYGPVVYTTVFMHNFKLPRPHASLSGMGQVLTISSSHN